MRPRHKAAENVRLDDRQRLAPANASMRPRHKAAENVMSSVTPLVTELELQ